MNPRALRIIAPLALALALALATSARAGEPPATPDASAVEFFEKKVRPILVDNCYNCHSANTNAKGELRVDDRGGLLAGGNSGPAVVPGDPARSLLLQAVRHEGEVAKMPPKKKLTDEQVADLARWIEQGAAWPDLPAVAVGKPNAKYDKLRAEHWAWQPLREPDPPEVRDPSWPRDPIDRFVLAGLEAKGLPPVPDADRPALIRRVTFDLTGLPPTPEDVSAFEADAAPDAFARVVDRLLASPGFRRAVGPALARRRPVWRVDRVVAERPVPPGLAVSRLRHRRLQQRQAV